jgi:hypothetical protein
MAMSDRRLLAALSASAALAVLPAPANEAAPETGTPRFEFSGFVDVYYAYNDNHPADRANFVPGVGTTAKRADEFALNLAQVEVTMAADPVGFHIVVGAGNGEEILHAAELSGAGTGTDVWRHLLLASVVYQSDLGRGLRVEAGIFASPIGFESFASKDNWNYTRSWMAEYSPYYQTGINVSYPFTDRWSGRVDIMNGWQIIGENNGAKTFGAQVGYDGARVSAKLNVMTGPELPDNDDDWRTLGDLVFTIRPSENWQLGAAVDVAHESQLGGPAASWWGAAAYARVEFAAARSALALRLEQFDDPDGAISGTPQDFTEGTLTFEYRPSKHLILKLEARHDHSSAPVFATTVLDLAGAPAPSTSESLVILGCVAAF